MRCGKAALGGLLARPSPKPPEGRAHGWTQAGCPPVKGGNPVRTAFSPPDFTGF